MAEWSLTPHAELRMWDALDIGDEAILVLHDIGSMFGFDWANRNRSRVQGIAYMESIVAPLLASDFPEYVQEQLKHITPEGMEASLQGLDFIDGFLLSARDFTSIEKDHYRAPFLQPGEDRRPLISFDLPIEGHPTHTVKIAEDYSRWLSESDIPKLFIRAQPGYLLTNRLYDIAQAWPNQTEVTIKGDHYIQETTPDLVGEAIAGFVTRLRSDTVRPLNTTWTNVDAAIERLDLTICCLSKMTGLGCGSNRSMQPPG